jgi:hypothetical protein
MTVMRPTREELERQRAKIAAIIAQHPAGIDRQDLMAAYNSTSTQPLLWRTVLRRLEELIRDARVVPVHAGRHRIYRSLPTNVLVPPYDPTFLEQYLPGVTWYLPEALRTHLATLGRTPVSGQAAGTYARHIYEQLLIDLAWSSSRLEGNAYSRIDTKELFELGRSASGASAEDAQMLLNHRAAIATLVEDAGELDFNRRTFVRLHAALSENLLGNRRDEGALRTRAVMIDGSMFTPLAIPQKIEELFDNLLAKAHAIPDPFEQAFFIMVHLPYLQPFVDVNKRTSRLGANLSLVRANMCPLSFVDVPQREYVEGTMAVYELRRVELLRDLFAWAYERSCAQYTVLRESAPPPNPIRLQYRTELRTVITACILELRDPTPALLMERTSALGIPAEDRAAFVTEAREDFLALNEAVFARYRFTPNQFAAWKAMMDAKRHAAGTFPSDSQRA